MAKNFLSSTLLFILLLGSHAQQTYTPGGNTCSTGASFTPNSKPEFINSWEHANIIQRSSSTGSWSDSSCYQYCTGQSNPSAALTIIYRTNSHCYCYFNAAVDGVDQTTDGYITSMYDSSSSGHRMMIVCPTWKYFEENARCPGTSFSNVASLDNCRNNCLQTADCKAFSYNFGTDQCFACSSGMRTSNGGDNVDYSTRLVTVTPYCEGLPGGNGAHGEWKWTGGLSYTDHPKGIYQDQIKFSCASGYTLGGSGKSKFECDWDGSWVPVVNGQGVIQDAVTCVPQECTLELGLGVTSDCGDSLSYLDSCTASCTEGYAANSATLSCVLDGSVVAVEGSLECEAETCPISLESYPGLESDCGDALDVYQSCAVSCAPYYMPTDFLFVGNGFCRPEGCDIEAQECRVNGYRTEEDLTEEECRAQCKADEDCVGIAISGESWQVRCHVYTSNADSIVPPNWTDFNQDYFSVYTASGHEDVDCYKIIDPEAHELTCNWENSATSLGQPVECVCQEPLMDFASPTLISNAESEILENGQVNIHVQFPQYLNDVVLKFDSLDGTVTYDESNDASNEGWTLLDADCSQVLESQFAFSELQELASVSVENSELTFSLFFISTETFPHPVEGFPVTRTVVKPLTFTLELATSIELSLDITLHSQIESIEAVEFNYLWADLAGYTNEEIIASIEADLEAQGINVEVLAVQSEDELGGFRRALNTAAADAHVVIAFGGSEEEMAALLDALQNQNFGFNILENAVMLNVIDYTQIVSVTSEYSDVANVDGSSTATIHFSTAINEPWEFTGVYTMEDFSGSTHALQEMSQENSCKQEGELICEQQWTLVIEISAEDVCATAEHSFTVNMQSAHGAEVMEDAHVDFNFSVLPNQDQCEQITDLGEASNVEGVVQVWNSGTQLFEESPSFEIFLDDVLTFQATVTSHLGDLSSITLSNVKASQLEIEVCADCLTEFTNEFEFICSSCADNLASNGNQMDFTMRLSSEVFTGYSGDSGKPTQLVFTFDLEYVQGIQRRLLAIVETGSRRSLAVATSEDESHVSSIEFGLLRAVSAEISEVLFTESTIFYLLVILVVCLLVSNIAVLFPRLCCKQKQQSLTNQDDEPVEITS